MKLLLLRPFFSVEKFYFPRFINEPLGLEYLAAFLKDKHTVKIIDGVAEGWNKYRFSKNNKDIIYQGLNIKEIIQKINRDQPDIVGLTWLFSAQNDCISQTVKALKQNNPKMPIVVGGPHPSANPQQILEDNPSIDIVVFGEGELTLKELLDKKLKDLDSIEGIAFKDGEQIKVNPPRPLIKDLNYLPLPARDLAPYQNYNKQNLYAFLYHHFQNKTLATQISRLPFLDKLYYFLRNKIKQKELLPSADIIFSRGCPYHCTFCAIHNLWKHRWRIRSAENILEEIDLLVHQYGIKHLIIQDDNFNASKEMIIKICRGLVERKYDLTLSSGSGVYVPTLDKEVLFWLKKAGFKTIKMCIESGSQRVLDEVIKKRINLKQVEKIVAICKELGLKTEADFMFGLPGETIEEMKETIAFSKGLGFDQIKRFIFQPFPNTELYELCVKNNYLTKDYDPKKIYITSNRCYVKTEDFSPEEVVRLVREN
jgi:radical SAM superfamily enzyme YgiQ (UPF0313 family)